MRGTPSRPCTRTSALVCVAIFCIAAPWALAQSAADRAVTLVRHSRTCDLRPGAVSGCQKGTVSFAIVSLESMGRRILATLDCSPDLGHYLTTDSPLEEFFVIGLTVRNTATSPQWFDPDRLFLFFQPRQGSSGRDREHLEPGRFLADLTRRLYCQDAKLLIPPGRARTMKLAFASPPSPPAYLVDSDSGLVMRLRR